MTACSVGGESQSIWFDDVVCPLKSSCLNDCKTCPSTEYHDCTHNEDVTIRCSETIIIIINVIINIIIAYDTSVQLNGDNKTCRNSKMTSLSSLCSCLSAGVGPGGVSGGIIAGIVIAASLLLCCCLATLFVILLTVSMVKRRRRGEDKENEEHTKSREETPLEETIIKSTELLTPHGMGSLPTHNYDVPIFKEEEGPVYETIASEGGGANYYYRDTVLYDRQDTPGVIYIQPPTGSHHTLCQRETIPNHTSS